MSWSLFYTLVPSREFSMSEYIFEKDPTAWTVKERKWHPAKNQAESMQIHITGDAQDTLFSPRQLTAFMSCLHVPGHLLRLLESDSDCRRGCWGLLTHRKLGAWPAGLPWVQSPCETVELRAEKSTWHISRCRHIRTDIFFGIAKPWSEYQPGNMCPTWQPAARPLWRLSGWRLPRWDLGGLCWEIAMKQIILLTNEIQWKSHLFGQVSTVLSKFRELNLIGQLKVGMISFLHLSSSQLVLTTFSFGEMQTPRGKLNLVGLKRLGSLSHAGLRPHIFCLSNPKVENCHLCRRLCLEVSIRLRYHPALSHWA